METMRTRDFQRRDRITDLKGGSPMNFDYLKQKRILLVDDEQELLDMVV